MTEQPPKKNPLTDINKIITKRGKRALELSRFSDMQAEIPDLKTQPEWIDRHMEAIDKSHALEKAAQKKMWGEEISDSPPKGPDITR